MNVFDLYAKLTLDISGYEKNLSIAKKSASGLSGGLGKVMGLAGAAIGAATTAVGAFGAASVAAGRDFDESMSQVQATMLKTTDQMENEFGHAVLSTSNGVKQFEGNLRQFAQFLGENTAFSATQAADALNYMALAGYDTQESMTMLPNVLNLAAAGAMDLALASDMVTDTQTAFGITAERTAQMVDEMAKAASTGNTNVTQLGNAFLVIGGLAKDLNGGMVTLKDGTTATVDGVQELEIALTAMANAGIKGGKAGTHMRNMLLKLSSPTDKGEIAFERLGVSIFEAGGQMRSLKDIFTDLNRSLSAVTQEEKLQKLSAIFNTRDIAAAQALLAATAKDWDKIGASILDAEGAAADMAEIQLDNLAGDMTLFQSALEGAQIAISDQLTPSLRDFVQFGTKGLSELTSAFKKDGLNGAVDKFGDLLSDGITMIIEKLPQMIEAGTRLVIALVKGIAKNKGKIAQAARDIVKVLSSTLMKEFPRMKNTFLMLESAFNVVQKALEALFGFINRHSNGVIAAIKGIVAGLLVFKTTMTVINGVTTAMKALQAVFAVAMANPFVLAIAGAAALIGLMVTLTDLENAEAEAAWNAATQLSDAQKERGDRVREYLDQLGEIEKNNQRVKQSIDEQYGSLQDQKEILMAIVDDSGKIKSGYEEQAGAIVTELNQALGTDLEINGNILSNYQEQMAAIDQIIEKKKIEAMIDANKAGYEEAYANQKQLQEDMINTQNDYNETLKAYEENQWKATEAAQNYAWAYQNNSPRMAAYMQQIQELDAEMEAQAEKLNNLKPELEASQQAFYENQAYMKNYQDAVNSTNGSVEDMQKAFQNLSNNLITDAPLEILEQQVRDAKDEFTELIDMRKDGLFVSDEDIEAAAHKLEEVIKIFEDAGGDIKDGLTSGLDEHDDVVKSAGTMAQDLIDSYKDTVESHSPSKVFIEEGENITEGLSIGIEQGTPTVLRATSTMIERFEELFKGLSDKATAWGVDMMSGFTKGITSKMSSLTSAMSTMSETVKSYIHFSEPDVGPLSDFHTYAPDMMKLFAEGVRENRGVVADAVSDSFDFKDMMTAPEYRSGSAWDMQSAPTQNYDSAIMQKVVDLLQQIADRDMDITLEGDAADIFNIVARENRIQTRATGYNQLSMVSRG